MATGHTVSLDVGVSRTDLPRGPQVWSESVPGARSLALGVWVGSGSAHEPDGLQGIAHLLEHMVFKATERRSAREIAIAIEGLGGSLDAYTSREHTLYQARVLGEHLETAVDVLTDLVFHPLLRQEDLELERNVILEEIAAVEDTPDDWIFDWHARALWGEHPYGRPILGGRETVRAIGREDLARWWAAAYRPSRCVVTAAGCVEPEALVEAVARAFPRAEGPAAPGAEVLAPEGPGGPRDGAVERETSQMHLCLGARAFAHTDLRRPALEVLTTVLGGGMSSRLFQTVREELGLAYAVYAFHSLYRRGGQLGVYAGTEPAKAGRALEAVLAEIGRLASEPVPEAELAAAKNQVKGHRLLALESTTARMVRLAQFPLFDEPYETVEDSLARTEGVPAAEVQAVGAELLAPERLTVVRLGPPERARPVLKTLPA